MRRFHVYEQWPNGNISTLTRECETLIDAYTSVVMGRNIPTPYSHGMGVLWADEQTEASPS
jgi:hypothetical protein